MKRPKWFAYGLFKHNDGFLFKSYHLMADNDEFHPETDATLIIFPYGPLMDSEGNELNISNDIAKDHPLPRTPKTLSELYKANMSEKAKSLFYDPEINDIK